MISYRAGSGGPGARLGCAGPGDDFCDRPFIKMLVPDCVDDIT